MSRTAFDALVPGLPPALDAREVAYRGLVKLHAAEISRSATFRTRGTPTTTQVHAIARDLDDLRNPHPLDETIEAVLARADGHLESAE